ncbi:MAG: NAD(P)H-binding protein, partial [Myxococcales bacterium]|nr:NAD(P)H-binding protein [Myxococcales bacterium]
MGRTVALAGGTGFIGRQVAARLRASGHAVVILARGSRGPDASGELRRCDLVSADDDALAAAFAGCDALVNLVGIKRETPGQSFEQAHVDLPLRLAAAARRSGVGRMIHISVAGARNHARSVYLDSKARGEAALAADCEEAGP